MSSNDAAAPEQPESGSPQSLRITSGDHSPVNVFAPQARSTAGGTANANVNLNQPTETPAVDPYPKSRWRDPKLIGICTVLLLLIAAATLYFTIYPTK